MRTSVDLLKGMKELAKKNKQESMVGRKEGKKERRKEGR